MKHVTRITLLIVGLAMVASQRGHAATLWTSSEGVASFIKDSSVPDTLLKAIEKNSDAATAAAWKSAYQKAYRDHLRDAELSMVTQSIAVRKTETKGIGFLAQLTVPKYKAAYAKELKAGVIELTFEKDTKKYVLKDTNSDPYTLTLFEYPTRQ